MYIGAASQENIPRDLANTEEEGSRMSILPSSAESITTTTTASTTADKLLNPTNHVKLFTLLLPILLTYLFFRRRRTSQQQKTTHLRLPPSPPKLPIIGNFHQLMSTAHPHRSLHSLSQRYGDLMLIRIGSVPSLVVSSAASAREIMKTHDLAFADRPQRPRSVFRRLLYGGRDISAAPYGEYWRQMRSLAVIHLLSSIRVRSYSEVREEETALMVDSIRKMVSREVDLTAEMMTVSNNVVCKVALGRKYHGAGSFRKVMGEFIELLGGFYLGEFIPWMGWIHRWDGVDASVDRVVKELDGIFERIIQEHSDGIDKSKRDKSKDFVDVLLELQREQEEKPAGYGVGFTMDRDSIKAIILDAFAAGTDTTYAVLEWAMAELLRHPKTMKTLQIEVRRTMSGDLKTPIKESDLDKMPYLKAVTKETLRLHPPIPLLVPRASTQHTILNGYDIPKGTQVITNAWAIQRDPAQWSDPERFWPERFLLSEESKDVDFHGQDFGFIPFGAGRRGCPGVVFAMATVELVLANLVGQFDWVLPSNDGGGGVVDMEEISALTIHKKKPLVVVPCLPAAS